MKYALTAIALALLAAPAQAAAPLKTARVLYLSVGDTAVTAGGDTTCSVVKAKAGGLAFRCQVGGDYRAKYGAIVGSYQVALTQYTTRDRYRTVVAKKQTPIKG